MTVAAFVPADAIRAAFSDAMSTMYRAEVPLYGELIAIVEAVNAAVLAGDPAAGGAPDPAGHGRLSAERHGAIRLGTADELSLMRRAFAVMGMEPVGYYDLAPAGVPVHSTAFRPVDPAALAHNPFRMFTSLLRLDLIEDADLRAAAANILAGRRIVSEPAIRLIAQAERDGGLGKGDAARFVAAILDTFRWQGDALVDGATYRRLLDTHRLVADVVAFRGPHINHLTPRTLDIDAAQAEMRRRGIAAKAVIEGPPRRRVPILLRQTSFRALDEPIRFGGAHGTEPGSHSARFGEIEQRGAALTPKGRALYDRLLEKVPGADGDDRAARLATAFAAFPDTIDALRREGLAFFRHAPTPAGLAARGAIAGTPHDWVEAGWASAEPIVYEDFLPVSAAGIFRSNLGDAEQKGYGAAPERAAFERALGAPVRDEFALYAAIEAESIARTAAALGVAGA